MKEKVLFDIQHCIGRGKFLETNCPSFHSKALQYSGVQVILATVCLVTSYNGNEKSMQVLHILRVTLITENVVSTSF